MYFVSPQFISRLPLRPRTTLRGRVRACLHSFQGGASGRERKLLLRGARMEMENVRLSNGSHSNCNENTAKATQDHVVAFLLPIVRNTFDLFWVAVWIRVVVLCYIHHFRHVHDGRSEEQQPELSQARPCIP